MCQAITDLPDLFFNWPQLPAGQLRPAAESSGLSAKLVEDLTAQRTGVVQVFVPGHAARGIGIVAAWTNRRRARALTVHPEGRTVRTQEAPHQSAPKLRCDPKRVHLLKNATEGHTR